MQMLMILVLTTLASVAAQGSLNTMVRPWQQGELRAAICHLKNNATRANLRVTGMDNEENMVFMFSASFDRGTISMQCITPTSRPKGQPAPFEEWKFNGKRSIPIIMGNREGLWMGSSLSGTGCGAVMVKSAEDVASVNIAGSADFIGCLPLQCVSE